jgi:MoxR-like ATPase
MTADLETQNYATALFGKISDEYSKVVVGRREALEMLVTALLADGHVLLEGLPGVAKTHIAKTFSKTLGCSFSRIQFTPDLLPADIVGSYVYDQKLGDFRLRKGPIVSNVVLIDEINRGMPKTQSATLEIMQERQVTIEGHTLPVEDPFIVLATKNPIEVEGVYPLSEAQIDRFMFSVELGYPASREEDELLQRIREIETVDVQQVATAPDIHKAKGLVDSVHVAAATRTYMVNLIHSTRSHPKARLGGSPRALIHLYKSSKALALIRGRDYVIPDDVKELAPPILSHRLLLTPEADAEDASVAEVIKEAIAQTPIPRNEDSRT